MFLFIWSLFSDLPINLKPHEASLCLWTGKRTPVIMVFVAVVAYQQCINTGAVSLIHWCTTHVCNSCTVGMPSKMRDGPQRWSKSTAACLVVFYITPRRVMFFPCLVPMERSYLMQQVWCFKFLIGVWFYGLWIVEVKWYFN